MAEPTFLGLPLEIRNEIYGYLLADSEKCIRSASSLEQQYHKEWEKEVARVKAWNANVRRAVEHYLHAGLGSTGRFRSPEQLPTKHTVDKLSTYILCASKQIYIEASSVMLREYRFSIDAHDMKSDLRPSLLRNSTLHVTVTDTDNFLTIGKLFKEHQVKLKHVSIHFHLDAAAFLKSRIRKWESPSSLRSLLRLQARSAFFYVHYTDIFTHERQAVPDPDLLKAFHKYRSFWTFSDSMYATIFGWTEKDMEKYNWKARREAPWRKAGLID